MCACMTDLFRCSADRYRVCPQVALAEFFIDIHKMSQCTSAIAFADRVSARVGEDIDGDPDRWGVSPTKEVGALATGASGSKRCRASGPLKALVCGDLERTAPEVARESGLMQPNAGTARGWVSRWLSERRATSLIKAEDFRGTLSSCFDAARLGRPAMAMGGDCAEAGEAAE